MGTYSVNGVPEINRTPGYPLFLAPFLLLRHWEIAVVAAQCLLGGVVAGVAHNLAAKLRDERAGIIAAILFTISPLTLEFSALILTERLSSFFLALICAAMFLFLDTKRISYAVLTGILSACAIFTRPAALYMPYGIAVFFLGWGLFSKAGWKKTTACTLLFLLCALAPVKAWELRNERLAGYKGFSAISAINLYFYNAAAVLAKQEGVPFVEMQERIGYLNMDRYFEQHPELKDLSVGGVYAKMALAGKSIIRNNLSLYSIIHLRGMLLTIITLGKVSRDIVAGIASLFDGVSVRFVYYTGVVFMLLTWHLFSLLGIRTSLPRYPGQTLFLMGVMAYFILISGGPAGYARFRDPIGFLFAVLAGVGFDYLWTRKKGAMLT